VPPGSVSNDGGGSIYYRSNTGVISEGVSSRSNYRTPASPTSGEDAPTPSYTAHILGSDGVARTPMDAEVWGDLTASVGEVQGPALRCSGWGAAVHTVDGPSEVWGGGNGLSLAAREHIYGVWAGGVSS
jgi:hypothetical protein